MGRGARILTGIVTGHVRFLHHESRGPPIQESISPSRVEVPSGPRPGRRRTPRRRPAAPVPMRRHRDGRRAGVPVRFENSRCRPRRPRRLPPRPDPVIRLRRQAPSSGCAVRPRRPAAPPGRVIRPRRRAPSSGCAVWPCRRLESRTSAARLNVGATFCRRLRRPDAFRTEPYCFPHHAGRIAPEVSPACGARSDASGHPTSGRTARVPRCAVPLPRGGENLSRPAETMKSCTPGRIRASRPRRGHNSGERRCRRPPPVRPVDHPAKLAGKSRAGCQRAGAAATFRYRTRRIDHPERRDLRFVNRRS